MHNFLLGRARFVIRLVIGILLVLLAKMRNRTRKSAANPASPDAWLEYQYHWGDFHPSSGH